MADKPAKTFRSGDALVVFDADLTVISWNRAAEELTGITAEEAVGRRCWEVLAGHDEHDNLVCHRDCSAARLARQGWPVKCQRLSVRARGDRRPVEMSTVALDQGGNQLFLHVIVPVRDTAASQTGPVLLTPRQKQVLRLLAEGLPAKVIATRLGLSEATVRNHIRAVLVALGAHSQLQAIATAHRLQLIA